jgi:crotonobetainyl-CoA:carnitine CoA-transferase CaiB-like acyl-CoA transferase
MVSLSAMGHTGPWRDGVGFGPTLQALAGLTGLTAYGPDEPVGLGYAYGDHVSGLYAVLAILAALEARGRTGQGSFVDLAEYEAAVTLMGPALLAAQGIPGEGEDGAGLEGCYRCAGEDQWCVLSLSGEEAWQALCRVMGHPGWAGEERFATLAGRLAHREALDRRIGEWTGGRTAAEAVQLLNAAGIPAGVVQDGAALAADPHLQARGFFRTLTHPVLGPVITDAPPIRFPGDPLPAWRPAPLLGADSRAVLREWLGLEEGELARLEEEGVLR